LKPILALTQGDPAGIGPELCLKAIADESVLAGCRPMIIGDLCVLEQVGERLNLALPSEVVPSAELFVRRGASTKESERAFLERADRPVLIDCACIAGAVEPGRATCEGGEASYRYIATAAEGAIDGLFDAVVTAPITKSTLRMAGVHEPGHTEILARLTGTKDTVMLLYSPRIAVSLVTIHQPLSTVPGSLTVEAIVRTAHLTREAIHRLRGREPRLAVLGLNPHAGEEGMFGREEIEIVTPAIEQCRAEGLDVEGPLPPDAAFMPHNLERFDAHVALYHDQGLIPFKMISMHDGVNTTLGLPIIRTSPDHGTAYDIAWRGKADPSSMLAAIHLAANLAGAAE